MSNMRQKMRKEIVTSIIESGKVEIVDGLPTVTDYATHEALGNLSTGNKAIEHINEVRGKGFTIFKVETKTQTYEALVTDFLKIASPIKVDEQPTGEQPAGETE